MTIANIFFSFKDRIGRSTFWIASLSSGIVFGLIYCLIVAVLDQQSAMIAVVVSLPLFAWISQAIYAKRLHDLGKSGWWILLSIAPLCVALFGLGLAQAGATVDSAGLAALSIPFSIGSLGLSLWSFWLSIQVMFFAGEPGSNDYGNPPRLAVEYFNSFEEDEQMEGAQSMANQSMPRQSAAAAPPAVVMRPKTVQPARPSGFGRRGHPA